MYFSVRNCFGNLLPALAFALAGSLTLSAAQLRAQSVSGTVRNSINSLPLADAQVSIVGRSATTNAAGRFLLNNVPQGQHQIVVQRVGISQLSQSITVGPQGVENIELLVTPAAQLISPVVVTATGESTTRRSQSATVDVVSGTELRETRASHPSGILNRIAGVHISELTGEGHSTAIRQPITTKPVYLYLEDGVPTRSTGFFNHNALYEVNLPQAGGIEVLKGPGTALYGSDAIGGVVNSLTRAAPATPGVEATVEGGSNGYRRMLLSGGGWFGGSGIRADLNVTDSDGWKQNAPYQRISGTLRWDAMLGGGVSARTVVTGSTIDQFDVPSVSRAQFASEPTLNRAPIAYRRVDALRLSSAFEKEADEWMWSVTPYARYNVMELLPQWQLTYDPQTWDTRNTSLGVVARYRRDFEPLDTRIIFGADAESSPGSFIANGITPTRSPSDDRIWTSYTFQEADYDYDVTYSSLSPYLHAEFTPMTRVRVDVGARYDASSYDYKTNLAPLQTGPHRRPENTVVKYSRLSPKAGVVVTVTDNASVFASYREGFRTPSQTDAFRQNGAASTVDLKPVKVRSLETGVRGNLAGKVIYSLSVYDMTARDDILNFVTPANTRETLNAGRTNHRGVELGLGAALPGNLRVDAAYSRARHKYIHWVPQESATPSLRIDYSGNTMEQAPRGLGNLLLTWTPGALKGGRAALEWSMLGKYYMDPANDEESDGYSLLNAHLNFNLLPNVELFARAANLLDRKYSELSAFDVFQGEQITAGTPRSIFVGMRYGWQK